MHREAAQRSIAEQLDKYPELRLEAIALKLIEGLNATKTKIATFQGSISDVREEPDFRERRQAAELLCKLKNAFPATKLDVTSNIKVEQLHEVSVELQHMTMEQLGEIVDAEPPALDGAP